MSKSISPDFGFTLKFITKMLWLSPLLQFFPLFPSFHKQLLSTHFHSNHLKEVDILYFYLKVVVVLFPALIMLRVSVSPHNLRRSAAHFISKGMFKAGSQHVANGWESVYTVLIIRITLFFRSRLFTLLTLMWYKLLKFVSASDPVFEFITWLMQCVLSGKMTLLEMAETTTIFLQSICFFLYCQETHR